MFRFRERDSLGNKLICVIKEKNMYRMYVNLYLDTEFVGMVKFWLIRGFFIRLVKGNLVVGS